MQHLSKRTLKKSDMISYRTAKEPEHRVAHIPPIEAPGPARDQATQISTSATSKCDARMMIAAGCHKSCEISLCPRS